MLPDILIQKRRLDVALYLLEHGADINAATTNRGKTFLHWIVGRNDTELVKWALKQGANVNIRNSSGWTPFHIACYWGYMDIVAVLVENDADIHAKDESDQTPLHLSCARGHRDVVQLLFDKGVDINAKTYKGETSLDIAKRYGHQNIVELLQKHGAK